VDAQLVERSAQVGLRGADRDAELGRDLLVREARRGEADDLLLPRREAGERQRVRATLQRSSRSVAVVACTVSSARIDQRAAWAAASTASSRAFARQ
jgi:hypothetical protein